MFDKKNNKNAFNGLKSLTAYLNVCSTGLKVHLILKKSIEEKSIRLVKEIENIFKGPKNKTKKKKKVKTHFLQKLKNKTFTKKSFFYFY